MRIMTFRKLVADHIFVMKHSYKVGFFINEFISTFKWLIQIFVESQKSNMAATKSISDFFFSYDETRICISAFSVNDWGYFV